MFRKVNVTFALELFDNIIMSTNAEHKITLDKCDNFKGSLRAHTVPKFIETYTSNFVFNKLISVFPEMEANPDNDLIVQATFNNEVDKLKSVLLD